MKVTVGYLAICCSLLILTSDGLGLTKVQAQKLVEANELFPKYELSNLKVLDSSIGKVIAIDYKLVEKGKCEGIGKNNLRARSDDGKLKIWGVSIDQDSGTIQLEESDSFFSNSLLRRHFGGNQIEGFEFYIVATMPEFPEIDFLLSNSVQDGNLSSKINARQLTAAETEQLSKIHQSKLPPSETPEGYIRVDTKANLVPGLPLFYGVKGEWKPGIVVSTNGSLVKLKPADSSRFIRLSKGPFLAVSNENLTKLSRDPQQFSLNFESLEDGNLILEKDYVPVPDVSVLLKGTPLKMEQGDLWKEVFYVGHDNHFVTIHVPQPFGINQLSQAKQLAIHKEILKEIKQDSAGDKYAKNVPDDSDDSDWDATDSFERMRRQTEAMHQKHREVVQKQHNEIMNRIRSNFARASNLDDLDIDGDKAKEKAKEKAKAKDKALDKDVDAVKPVSQSEFRDWSDKSGKFKIEATVVRQTDDRVWLKRKDGKVLEVELAKLCEADQQFLEESNRENPFSNIVGEDDSPDEKNKGK